MSKNICVVGTGYVGLIAAVGLADFGNTVVGVDIDAAKVSSLNAGSVPIYEPGVDEYLRRNLERKRLSFTTDVVKAVASTEVVIIAVGTPAQADGEADLGFVGVVADSIAAGLDTYKVIVTKSTVPVGTNCWLRNRIALASGKKPGVDFDVVSNPEFLREGKAISDFFHPDRTVIGYESDRAREIMFDVYRALGGGERWRRRCTLCMVFVGDCGTDQICVQCLSGSKDHLHKRNGQPGRGCGGGYPCGGKDHGYGWPHRSQIPASGTWLWRQLFSQGYPSPGAYR